MSSEKNDAPLFEGRSVEDVRSVDQAGGLCAPPISGLGLFRDEPVQPRDEVRRILDGATFNEEGLG